MIFIIGYLVILLVLIIFLRDFKEALARSAVIGILCAFVIVILNVCYGTMPNVRKMATEKNVFVVEGVNADTIVYRDKKDNLQVLNKDKVLLIKGDGLTQSLLVTKCMKKIGKCLFVQEIPEQWEAYIVSNEDCK